ncbi:uncharacterized protein C2845_PM05G24130 [Panicum miliaceum]|uniref:Uncharacterized protein n=1 Tax=Panicum miliaceum TaxID=4540 RepID=A0A3L6T3D7_PANMI|nr:uncharacterized protein C2845_PM05G24130 [Panicum miliaceum]
MDRRRGDRKRAREGEQQEAAAAVTMADGGDGAWRRPAWVFDLPWQKCRGGLGVAGDGGVGLELYDDGRSGGGGRAQGSRSEGGRPSSGAAVGGAADASGRRGEEQMRADRQGVRLCGSERVGGAGRLGLDAGVLGSKVSLASWAYWATNLGF